MRIGFGKDLHQLCKDRPLVLGGITIPSPLGELGHSDGDVLTHAVIDALLGAAALGDIGEFFPADDVCWKDARSLDMLVITCQKLRAAGWEIGNIDAVIECEQPKILPYREAIRTSLAAAMDIAAGTIFVKAKTGESLGDIGQKRAIAASAVCLIY